MNTGWSVALPTLTELPDWWTASTVHWAPRTGRASRGRGTSRRRTDRRGGGQCQVQSSPPGTPSGVCLPRRASARYSRPSTWQTTHTEYYCKTQTSLVYSRPSTRQTIHTEYYCKPQTSLVYSRPSTQQTTHMEYYCKHKQALSTLILLHNKQHTEYYCKHKQALSTLILLHNKQHTRNITVNTNKPCLLSSFYTTNNTHGILL